MNTQSGNTADFRLLLYIASICFVASIYIVIATYLNGTYAPNADATPLLPSFRSAFVPELEMPLHHAGFIIITALSTLLTFLLGKKINTTKYVRHSFVTSLPVTGFAILASSICWIFWGQATIPAPVVLLTCMVIIVFVLVGLWKNNSYMLNVVHFAGNIIRSTSLLMLISLLAWFIFSVYTASGAYEKILILFREDGYPFLDAFTQTHVISAMIAIVMIFSAIYIEQKRHIILPRIVRVVLHLGFIATIIWLLQILVPSLSYPNWGGASGFSEYLSIIAPVNDLLGGKTLLVNIHSQYGLIMTYILAGIFQVVELTKTNMYYLNLVTHSLGYIGIYFLLMKLVKGQILPMVGVFFLVMFQQFTYGTNPLFMGQAGYLRFGFWVIMAVFLILKPWLKWKPFFARATEYILLSIGTFWGFDVGVYFLGGYAVYKAVLASSHAGSLAERIRAGLISAAEVAAVVASAWIFISFLTLLRSGAWPEWERFTLSVGQFSSGWAMLPMRRFDGHLIVIPIYALSVALIVYQTIFSKINSDARRQSLAVMGFITVIGILQFSYFLGRSKVGNITVVMAPLVVVSIWMVQQVITKLIADGAQPFDMQTRLFGSLSAIFGTLLLSIIVAAGWINMVGHIPLHNPAAHDFDYIPQNIQESVDYINKKLGSTPRHKREITLVSGWDGDILIRTKSTNVIDTNNIEFFILTAQIVELGKQIHILKPEIIYMDAKPEKEKIEMLKTFVIRDYIYSKNIGYLDVWRRKE